MVARTARPLRRLRSLRSSMFAGLLVVAACAPTVHELRAATTTSISTTDTDTAAATTVPGSSSSAAPAQSDPSTPDVPSTSTDSDVTSTTSAPVTSAPADPNTVLALDLLALTVVENEHPDGYDRDLFHYPKSMGGGCTTRTEVLKRDSFTPAQVDPYGCTVVAGDWWSIYDRTWHTVPSELDIDHVVALKEAWDSGAWRWDDRTRTAFANDFTDPRTLRAITSSVNRDKSDNDPSNWLPPHPDDVCRYVGEWVAIKVRWGLSMDQSEFGRIRNLLTGQCSGTRVAPIDV